MPAASEVAVRVPVVEVQLPAPLGAHATSEVGEVQVLRHVAMGLSNREIGSSLEISIETVKEHVQNILRKLEAGDRTEAAVWAVKKGLV